MPRRNAQRGVPHHTFDIEGPSDPKELIKELEAKGIKVDDLRIHGEGPGYSVYVIDPGGNRIELNFHGEGLSDIVLQIPSLSQPSQLVRDPGASQRAVRRRRASPSRGPTS